MTTLKRRVLALAAAAIGSACGPGHDGSALMASGHVEATDVRVATKIAGRLVSFALREGDVIKAGQTLGKVDTTDLELLVAQARAEADQAGAELRLRLAGARKEDVEEAAAQAESASADLAGAQRDLDRLQALLDKGSGTTKSRDDARTRRDVAAARLAAAKQVLQRLQAGFRPEEKDAARAKQAALEARIAELQQQIQDATVVSPLDGVLTEKIAEEGETLVAGSALAVITKLSEPWLTVYVGEPDLGRVRLGQDADVVTDGGQSRTGKITFISSKAEFMPKNVQTRDERVKLVYRIKIGLENADGLWKPGMPAEARFRGEAAK